MNTVQNDKHVTQAEHAALERILNVYFRENVKYTVQPESEAWHIPLNDDETISGTFMYWSNVGHHVYHPDIHLVNHTDKQSISAMTAIEKLFEAFTAQANTQQTEDHTHQHAIFEDIKNSIQRTARYLEHRGDLRNEGPYIESEQSLYLGHPFHPTPKSAKGFTDADLERYAPECHTAFQLHYLSIDTALMHARYVDGCESHAAQMLLALAACTTADLAHGYALLPVHPYQMGVLQQQPAFQEAMRQGRIKDLGQRGTYVYPTSSVRTVFSKVHNIYLKLPIKVKITNFVRTNNEEQLARTLDAAEVIATLKAQYETSDFKLMFEEGYRAMQQLEDTEDFDLLANTGMIIREGIEDYAEDKEIHVLASLFETMPHRFESQLGQLFEQSGWHWTAWLDRYLEITLRPMLNLFAETGISLEAHVQNTLVSFEQGVPSVCYVRDLEGISISETIGTEAGLIPRIVASHSPVVDEHETAWHRFKYYIIVNHLGHFIATLGKATQCEEDHWAHVHETLQRWLSEADHPALIRCIQDLVQSPTFSAKANFKSKLEDCSETPIYVDMPNPIYINKEEAKHDQCV